MGRSHERVVALWEGPRNTQFQFIFHIHYRYLQMLTRTLYICSNKLIVLFLLLLLHLIPPIPSNTFRGLVERTLQFQAQISSGERKSNKWLEVIGKEKKRRKKSGGRGGGRKTNLCSHSIAIRRDNKSTIINSINEIG